MDRSEHPQTCANCLQSHTLPTYLSGGSKSPQGDLVCNPIFRQIHMPAIIEAAHDSPSTGATFEFQAAEIPTSTIPVGLGGAGRRIAVLGVANFDGSDPA